MSAAKHVTATGLADRRLIIVGDVHGCLRELHQLLQEVNFDGGKLDQLVSVGDLVRKGPDSKGVIELFMTVGGLAVAGNHEVKLKKQIKHVREGTLDPVEEKADYDLCQQLSDREKKWLKHLPFSIRFPDHGSFLAVHAGVVPGKPLEEHTRFELTEMRGVVNGAAVKLCRSGDAWARHYKGHLGNIVFGHDAGRGIQLHPNALGLDTGCCYGNHLSALIVQPNGARSISFVRAHEVYCEPVTHE